MEEVLTRIIQGLVLTIEALGAGIIVFGIVRVTLNYVRQRKLPDAYNTLRADLGRAILLGLEFLVAADIIGTVTIAPTFTSLGVLAGIVAIRTFLSFSLELEINGRWPWQRP